MSRYSVNEYTAALQSLMPGGLVWPKISGGVQTSTLRALARSYQRSDEDARDLLDAAFPSTATAMLPEWEATLGLPDLCAIGEIDSMIQRQRAVVSKLFGIGGQSVDYFIRVAAALGYTISITQYRQACAGMSVCGDAINGEEWPFAWLIISPETTINYAQSGLTYCRDPLRTWGNKQLECRLTVLNPSHTILKFGYIS
ncbi:YmfQ family protein [Yersinia kristensenii]|uniref:YmfQ family protein n=1 Tax=Yersinia kristensenii TaxID=28152 RepID=UPI0005EA0EB6|nr:YmfQ family protein [Yersinia kristensenii]MDA5473246.1 YmfQ family protein [Yersinia kristensenii]MDA5475642.1 YmfQ family protein [Yersinia kristensenii]MDA5507062.1 YmfQ family protein [Yersinia kristensenii]MDA5523360.1 YmfQ family protein [Yersinia kristensenii]NIK96080.1 YmfQ family protein [Yersinia kristensenii]